MEVGSDTKKIKIIVHHRSKKCGMAEKSDLLAKACKVTFYILLN